MFAHILNIIYQNFKPHMSVLRSVLLNVTHVQPTIAYGMLLIIYTGQAP